MTEQLSADDRARRFVQELSSDFDKCRSLEEAAALAIREAEKQAQAEVLAACVARLNEIVSQDYAEDSPEQKAVSGAAVELLFVQPAAKDLEELLREAELKGLRLDHIQHGIIDNSCMRCSRIAELEKARAIKE